MLMLADKQEDGSGASPPESDKTYNAKDFVVAARAFNVHPAHHEERKRAAARTSMAGRQAPRLRHQPDLPLAGREGVQPGKPSIVLQPMVVIKQVVEKCPKRE
jgi:hypothetical protein